DIPELSTTCGRGASHPRSPAMRLPAMTTTESIPWAITAIGSDTAVASAEAADHTTAWTAALRAARTALLTGDLDTIAVTIGENHGGALYSPARDQHGRVDPAALTAGLVDLYQAATASEIAHHLADHPTT
ncbi:MAG: hypothetical protein ACRDS0_37735, partial [Pseudonocardiaceae bacterium]